MLNYFRNTWVNGLRLVGIVFGLSLVLDVSDKTVTYFKMISMF